MISSNSYFKHYIQTRSCVKNRNAWVLSLFFLFGIRSHVTSKRETKWCMVADWLNCKRLLFTFCGICITSNSAKRSTTRTNLSPLTFFWRHQWVLRTVKFTGLHNSLPCAQKQYVIWNRDTWSWEIWLYLLWCFSIYLHFVCMRGHVSRYCRRKDVEVSYNTYFKMNNLQIQYGT